MSNFAFDAAGPGHALPLVLIHGSVVTRKMWTPQLQSLSDGFRVIAPDLPGHGDLADVPFSFPGSVDVVADMIRSEARTPVLVAGLSLGGYVAMALGAAHPELVAGLVLCGCSINFTGASGLYLKLAAALLRRGWLAPDRARVERRTRRMFPPQLAEVADLQVAAGLHPEWLPAAFAALAGRDFARLASTYPGPCLILNGERDRAARRGAPAFAAALRCRAEVIADAGHACSLDQPALFDAALRRFAAPLLHG